MELFYPSLVAFLVLFLSLALHVAFNKPRKSNINLPPGRTGLPVIGETLEFHSTGRSGHPEKFIFDRIAKYSSNVFRTSLIGSPTIVFCGSDGNKFLFSNENKLVQVWWPSSVDKIFGRSTQTGTKEESALLRGLLHNFLNPEALHRYIGIINQISQSHIASHWENKDQVNVFSLTKRYTFQLACRLLFSVEDADHIAKYEEAFGILVTGLWSIPVNLPGTAFNRAIKASSYLRKEFVAIIKQRKIDLAEGKTFSTQDILSCMLLARDEDGKFLDEVDVANKIFGLLFGGYETLASSCATIVMYLAELPEVYEGVYKEQMEIANSKAEGELLDWKDINKMKYSWNAVREVMRHSPLGHGGFREAITDFTYKGFSVPKGFKIFWSMQSTHKSPEYFPEPFKFDPSRFDGFGPAPYTFVPFGGGARICPGNEYARLVILVFVHHLVKRFKWKKVIPDEKIMLESIPKPEKGLPVFLYPHDKTDTVAVSK